MNIDYIKNRIKNKEEIPLIETAFNFASTKLLGIDYSEDETLINHILGIVNTLIDFNADSTTLISCLLYETINNGVSKEEMISEMSTKMNEMKKSIEEKTASIYVTKTEFNSFVSSNPTNQSQNKHHEKPEKSNQSIQLKQLEEWTGLKQSSIIFNSETDNWSKNANVLNEKIIGKKQLIFLIENDNGETFGYYVNSEINNQYYTQILVDKKSFEFNLTSKNGRLSKPMKFEIKDCENGGICLFEKFDELLINLGDIYLYKQHKKNQSYCVKQDECVNYHGINNALCGSCGYNNTFDVKKFIVIQMK